jgi:hypothetical protein
MAATEERRKRKRIALHWPVYLYRNQSTQSIESTTENLTSNGFYCVSEQPFQAGEQLECVIAIPAGAFGYSEAPIRLQCHVKVMRVENQSKNFGLGCYIEDYELIINSKPESKGTAAADPHR